MALVIVFYDISDDKTRERVARVLEALGLRQVQRSVFIGRGGFREAREAVRAASTMIDRGRDSVAALVVPEDYGRRLLVAGRLMAEPMAAGERIAVI